MNFLQAGIFMVSFIILTVQPRSVDNVNDLSDEELLQILKDLKMELAEEKHHLKETVFKHKPAPTQTTQNKPVPMHDDEDTPEQQLTQKKPQLNAEDTQETQDSKEFPLTDGKRDSRTESWDIYPRHPVVFTAVRNRGFQEGVYPVAYDVILANTGEAFNNPEFQAPYSGVYRFNVNFSYGKIKSDLWITLMLDNKVVFEHHLDTNSNSNGNAMDFTLNLHLHKGQTTYIQVDADGNVEHQSHIFSGELLYVDPY